MRSASILGALGVASILSGLTGCASRPSIPYKDVSYPPLKQSSTAYLGDRLLMQGRGFTTDIVRISAITGRYGHIKAGEYCRYPNSEEFFSFTHDPIVYISFAGTVRGYGQTLEYKEATNEVCLDDMWTGCFDSSFGSIQFEKGALCSDPNSFQQIIEYNGKSGDILNFTYREFHLNSMNSAFTTNFTMDKKEGDTITYKGAVLKVDKATNQQINYVVLKNFNNAGAQ